jgi:hypothetical protein
MGVRLELMGFGFNECKELIEGFFLYFDDILLKSVC